MTLYDINCDNTVLYRNHFETYTVTRIHCYMGIISRILTDSNRMNKREYRLYVFIESLYNDMRKVMQKIYRKTLFCVHPYSVRIRENMVQKKKKKIVLTVVLCSDSFYESIISILNCFHSVKMFSTEYFWESCHAEKTILPTP